ncbi:MAG: extracellular solute-binding protein [Limnochordia bacterium]
MSSVTIKRLACLVAMLVFASSVCGAKETIRLQLWHKLTGISLEQDMRMAKKYEDMNPGIEIEYVSVTTDYYNKLSVAIAGGAAPDIASLIATFSLAEFAEGGLIQPLEQFIQRTDIRQQDFFPLVWESWHYDGSIWAMTYDVDANMLYTNKALLDATGIIAPRTAEELDEAAAKLTLIDADGSIRRMGFVPWLGDAWSWLAPWDGQLWDPEDNLVTADSENVISMFAWMASYSERYDYARINALASQTSSTYHMGGPLYNDQLAMQLIGPWAIARFAIHAPGFEWDMIPLPYPAHGKPNATTGNALTLVIPTGAKHPKEAFDYIYYRTGLDYVLERQQVDPELRFPARIAAARAFVQKYPAYMPIASVLAGPNSRPYLPTMPVSVTYSTELSRARGNVIRLEQSPRAALEAVSRVIQARLDEVLATSRRKR